MADNLPLIPNKGSVCADVRPVLRQVFQELNCLPPLTPKVPGDRDIDDDQWLEKYTSECQVIWEQEGELKEEHARKLSKKPSNNIYRIREYEHKKKDDGKHDKSKKVFEDEDDAEVWRKRRGIIERNDLIPTLEQDAARDARLWIKNILTKSSEELSSFELRGYKVQVQSVPPNDFDELSSYSMSQGDLEDHLRLSPPPPPPIRPHFTPVYVFAVPPQLDFINFTIGQVHTRLVKFVNVHKNEIRLAIKPPRRRELDIEITGTRGLTVTSGSAAEIKVNFKPHDVKILRDQILVRVSVGKLLVVPINCYMEPPILDIIIPAGSPQILNSNLSSSSAVTPGSSEVIDLGAKLLGDVHCTDLVMKCEEAHAAFFIITEDAWITQCVNELTSEGSLIAPPFALTPACWHGGGVTKGTIWCRATEPGLQLVALRILASTAIVRPLILIADAICFRPEHITIAQVSHYVSVATLLFFDPQADEKNYDIRSDEDPECEYYVHIGTAFPNRTLSSTVSLINHSSVPYSYYWRERPWGVCSCWNDRFTGEEIHEQNSDDLCDGAKYARDREKQGIKADDHGRLVRITPERGCIPPRSSIIVTVSAPDVGDQLGIQRAVVILVLGSIPEESFPSDYEPMIVKSKTEKVDSIPGIKGSHRNICDVVCGQMEVWWNVVPVRFMLSPAAIHLPYSRRVKSITIPMQANQLHGFEKISASWLLPPMMKASNLPDLSVTTTFETKVRIDLPELPEKCPRTDVIGMIADKAEYKSLSEISYWCESRQPSVSPARRRVGLVLPAERVATTVTVLNDTYQHIAWSATMHHWCSQREASEQCEGREPCAACERPACACNNLRPTSGNLEHSHCTTIHYKDVAPETDGLVATLIQVKRAAGDVCKVQSCAGSNARAALVAYRVLAPKLIMRILSCCAENNQYCKKCQMDKGLTSRGSGILRPASSLVCGRRTCYRVRVTNITPVPTSIEWDDPIETEDVLKISFCPKQKLIGKYETKEFRVILEALKVSNRRMYVRQAHIKHAYKPLYLVIDAEISGLEIECEFPLGGEDQRNSFVRMRRSQSEELSKLDFKSKTASELFAYDDEKKEIQKENICNCKFKMLYIPPVKPLRRPEDDHHSIDFIYDPLPLTRICPCDAKVKPVLPEEIEPYCLQFRNVPLRTVRSLSVTIRNLSVLTARWSATVRNFPRLRRRRLATDPWAHEVSDPGVAVFCSPGAGTLASSGQLQFQVEVYGDTWGFYKDQLLINIDYLEPIVVDIWIEVSAPPLHFAIRPTDCYTDEYPTLWLSSSDSDRSLRVINTSRSDIQVHTYVMKEIERIQDVLPLRLYLRFKDILPATCPCCDIIYDSPVHSSSKLSYKNNSTISVEMETAIELYLSADHGMQDCENYKIEPSLKDVPAGGSAEFSVTLNIPPHYEVAPDSLVMLRLLPIKQSGPYWHRVEPPPLLVRLRQTQRLAALELTRSDVTVKLCAHVLPYDDVTRVRKRFQIRNVGTGHMDITAKVEKPWSILSEDPKLNRPCKCEKTLVAMGTRCSQLPVHLPPRCSVEMCVEVCVETMSAWPHNDDDDCATPTYDVTRTITNELVLFDDDNVLETLPLHLVLEYPKLLVEPLKIDFGEVCDGDSRKTYLTVRHTSQTETLDMMTKWSGAKGFIVKPRHFKLPPGDVAKVYVQYTAHWVCPRAEGCVHVGVSSGASWCRTCVAVRARATRTSDRRQPVHDYTDEPELLPAQYKHFAVRE